MNGFYVLGCVASRFFVIWFLSVVCTVQNERAEAGKGAEVEVMSCMSCQRMAVISDDFIPLLAVRQVGFPNRGRGLEIR